MPEIPLPPVLKFKDAGDKGELDLKDPWAWNEVTPQIKQNDLMGGR